VGLTISNIDTGDSPREVYQFLPMYTALKTIVELFSCILVANYVKDFPHFAKANLNCPVYATVLSTTIKQICNN